MLSNEMKLQSSLKRKVVLRETLHNTAGHKIKECVVKRVDRQWYGFTIDGDYFECRWDSGGKNYPTKLYFRNNAQLAKTKFGYEYGVTAKEVMYASSLHFGYGCNLVKTLWVLGEVLDKKNSYEYTRG